MQATGSRRHTGTPNGDRRWVNTQGSNVEHASDCGATARNPVPAVPLAAVIVIGRDSDQGADPLARELAELGQPTPECAAADIGNPLHAGEPWANMLRAFGATPIGGPVRNTG
jgi:hypothetical protein